MIRKAFNKFVAGLLSILFGLFVLMGIASIAVTLAKLGVYTQ